MRSGLVVWRQPSLARSLARSVCRCGLPGIAHHSVMSRAFMCICSQLRCICSQLRCICSQLRCISDAFGCISQCTDHLYSSARTIVLCVDGLPVYNNKGFCPAQNVHQPQQSDPTRGRCLNFLAVFFLLWVNVGSLPGGQ